jgi:hypothetical protein
MAVSIFREVADEDHFVVLSQTANVGYVGKYVFTEGKGYHWGREANPKAKRGNRRQPWE